MSVGSWTPDTASTAAAPGTIDIAVLQVFIDLSRQEQLDDLKSALAAHDSSWLTEQQHLMQQEYDTWFQTCDSMDNEAIHHLIRFFTLAEMQLTGWDAAEKNPVIPLVKLLKKRGEKLSKDTKLWIREHSSNRFLPNGPVLL